MICVGWLAATAAVPWLYAQNTSGHPKQNNAQTADRFVYGPGQMVTGPGQMVTEPGQMVTGPGQVVVPPGQMVTGPGHVIVPTPGVIAPFHSQTHQSVTPTQASQNRKRRIRPGRRDHHRHPYRPEYGATEGYALPYVVSDSGEAPSSASSVSENSASAGARSMVDASRQAGSGAGQPRESYVNAPSGNRPPYRGETEPQPEEAPSTAPNVIQSREPVLVIVMKDGKQRKVRNYALTPQMLIDLDGAASGKEVRIPLHEINLAATKKAATQAGLSFSVPTS